jgi:hypothetical protein
MGVPTSEVGYTTATTGREDHEVREGHVEALGGKKSLRIINTDHLAQEINFAMGPMHSSLI